MKNGLTLIIAILLISCNNKEISTKSIVVDCYKPKLTVENIFDTYYSVAFETNEDNLISSIDKLEINKEKILIND